MNVYALVGDYYHNEENSKFFLNKIFKQKNSKVTYLNLNEINNFIFDNVDIFILNLENRVILKKDDEYLWLNNDFEKKLKNYVIEGGKIIFIHNGLASYPENSTLVDIAKGYFVKHPEKNCNVQYLGEINNKNFDFTLYDEHYFVNLLDDTNIFLYSTSEHGKSAAAWHHKYGNGKVLSITPTHNKSGLENQFFQDFFTEAIDNYLIKEQI